MTRESPRHFAVSALAVKDGECHHIPYLIQAESRQQAIGKAYDLMYQTYPKDEGFGQHDLALVQVVL